MDSWRDPLDSILAQAAAFSTPAFIIHEDQWRVLLSARTHLVDLSMDLVELRRDVSNEPYAGVYGTFCVVHWDLHKTNPSTVPMFRDLLEHSGSGCRSLVSSSSNQQQPPQLDNEGPESNTNDNNQVIARVDLRALANLARAYDAAVATIPTNQNNKQQHPQPLMPPVKVLNVTAFVFHESRCGSTLTANILAAMNPRKHRVYSEAMPPMKALWHICGEDYSVCSKETAASIFADVIYLMSRTNNTATEHRVFFKIPSAGTRNLDVFTAAFPTTPYLFVYRDPVQVIMSHFRDSINGNTTETAAKCVTQRHSPPASVVHVVQQQQQVAAATPRSNSKDATSPVVRILAKELSPSDYCAAHLASITEAAMTHMTLYGTPVNYADLPNILYDELIPSWLGTDAVTENERERMLAAATRYSKNRGGSAAGQNFQSDSLLKNTSASESVRQAAAKYLASSYEALEALALSRRRDRQNRRRRYTNLRRY